MWDGERMRCNFTPLGDVSGVPCAWHSAHVGAQGGREAEEVEEVENEDEEENEV